MLNEEMSPLSPADLIAELRVPGKREIYVLGCGERRITFIAQQFRALNLVEALCATGLVESGTTIAVIGAGVAGWTAALRAAERGAQCQIFERNSEPWMLQRGCSTRWLHPYIYEWPKRGWFRSTARLPVLGWKANTVREVIQGFGPELARASRGPKGITQRLSVSDLTLLPDDQVTLSWNGGRAIERYDIAILALGFGEEADAPYSAPYWRDGDLHQATRVGTTTLISGCGDGGLTETLRICFSNFDHRCLTKLASSVTLRDVCTMIARIEQDDSITSNPTALTEAYLHLPVDSSTRRAIRELLKRGVRDTRQRASVTLNAERRSVFDRGSSPLNRFLVACLMNEGVVDYWPGRMSVGGIRHADGPDRSVFEVRMDDEVKQPAREFHRIVFRHGPAQPHPLERDFPELWASLQVRREKYAANPAASDLTRLPLPVLLDEVPVVHTVRAYEPDGFARIPREAVVDEILSEALSHDRSITNVYGPVGLGKSRLLFKLKNRLRESTRYVDCLFLAQLGPDDQNIFGQIVARTARPTVSVRPASLRAARERIDEFRRGGRSVVFLVDDVPSSDSVFHRELFEKLLRFPEARVICTSNERLDPGWVPSTAPLRYIEARPLSLDEARTYLSDPGVLTDDRLEALLARIASDAYALRPAYLRNLLLALAEDAGDIERAMQQARDNEHELIDAQIVDIMADVGVDPVLRFGLSAARRLNVGTLSFISTVAGTGSIDAPIGQAMLSRLFNVSLVTQSGPEYRWDASSVDAIRHTDNPPREVLEALLDDEIEQVVPGGDTVQHACAALSYLDELMLPPDKHASVSDQILSAMAGCLPDGVTLPADATLERHLRASTREDMCFLHARYLEGRGAYPRALEQLSRRDVTKPLGSAAGVVFQVLDKAGEFRALQEAIDHEIAIAGLPTRPSAIWPPGLLHYHGRVQQVAGSLAAALRSYEILHRLDEAPLVHRVHSLVEAATIFVFAEEPAPALAKLEAALELCKGDALVRERADVMRYQARALKLEHVLSGVSNGAASNGLDRAYALANEAHELATDIDYGEGKVWARVLQGRLDYFAGNFEGAADHFAWAERAIAEFKYTNALPHLYRHWALLDAVSGRVESARERIEGALQTANETSRRYVVGLLYHTAAKISYVAGDKAAVNDALLGAREEYRVAGLLEPPFSALAQRLDAAFDDPSSLCPGGRPW